MEIEKKYKLSSFPTNLPLIKKSVQEQGYLSVTPAVRIRRETGEDGMRYVLCVKGKGTLVREEVEVDLTKEKFEKLQNLLCGPLIRKDYRVYALPDGHKLECSLVDEGTDNSFYYAEVEFSSLEEAEAFVPPACVGEDITEKKGVSMSAFWQSSRVEGKKFVL